MKTESNRFSKVGKNHNDLLNRFRSLPSFSGSFLSIVLHGFQANPLKTSLPQETIALEVERKQSAGRAYVNMLPPR
ncbi:MAG TPA: hypothetical protein VF893_01850 [Candidatus Bathyarchaeia archaeon]